jgi:hypothetical protein
MEQETPDRNLNASFASSLLNTSGNPDLVVGNQLTWTLVNNDASKDLVITPFGSGKAGPGQYHFMFSFAPGALTDLPTLDGWDVAAGDVDQKGGIKSLYVALPASSNPLTIKARKFYTTNLIYSHVIQENTNNSKINVTVTAGGKNVTLGGQAIRYPQNTYISSLVLVSASTSSHSASPFSISFVGRRTVLNDGHTPNSVTFALTNMTQADIRLQHKVDLADLSCAIFTVWFDAAPNETAKFEAASDKSHTSYPWALARIDDLNTVTLSPHGSPWTVDASSGTWAITVSEDFTLKPDEPVYFTFSNIVTDLDPGITRMYLRFENVASFTTSVLIAELEKTPLLYGPLRGEGLYLSAGNPSTKQAVNYDTSALCVQQFGTKAEAATFTGGSVGIGTTAPGSLLSVAGGVAIGETYATSTIAANNLAVEGRVSIGIAEPVAALSVWSSTTGIRVSGWLDTGSSAGGFGYIGANMYINQADNIWKWANTHANLGGTAIQLNTGGTPPGNNNILFLRKSGPTTQNADVVPLESMRIDDNGNVGIGTPTPQSALDVNGKITAAGLAVTGSTTISQKNTLEFGFGLTKEGSAGKIGYQIFTAGLDIVGAGTSSPNRQICLWDDVHVQGNATIANKNVLEFGYGLTKEVNAGKIGYQTFSAGLDIVGAGTAAPGRQVHLWDDVYVHGRFWTPWSDGTTWYWCSLDPKGTTTIGHNSWEYAVLNSHQAVYSDARLKKNVTRIEGALDKLRKLNGCNYDWTEQALTRFTTGVDNIRAADPDPTEEKTAALRQAEREKRCKTLARPHAGVIAQEVEAVLPEAVSTSEDGYKHVSYHQLIPLLIEAIKEQDRAVTAQAALVSRQQVEIEQLKQALLDGQLPARPADLRQHAEAG